MTREQEMVLRRRRRQRTRNAHHATTAGGGQGASRWLLAVFLGLALLVTAGGGGAAIYGAAMYNDFASDVVPPEELLADEPRGGARIYDRNGVLLYEFVDEFGGLRRPVPLEEISEWVKVATVSTEDASFWENNGLNFRGLVRAAVENFAPIDGDDLFEGSGGSSITQQLAKNVYIPREERSERSVERKLKETVIALELTERYSKEQILEWYLNSISYGGIYVGIEAAAQGYFGKPASELTLAEAALLAGIPQQPARYDPFSNPQNSRARQREVLDLMVRHGAITQDEADRAADAPLEFQNRRFEIEAPHFVLGRVATELRERFGERALFDDGLDVYTTLDLELQHEAERVVDAWVTEFEEQSDGHNGALLAMDPVTGQLLAYVGSRDYFREDIEGRNDNVVSLNSPGSTLKPFTYMATFMEGWSTGTGIIDAPASVIDASTGQSFAPRNPSGNYQGLITVAEALGNSLNIPAFKAILYAGVEDTVDLLRQVGITTLDNPGGYGPALTLGGGDITLLDLTYAYSVLASNGVMRGQETLEELDPGERTLEPVALLRVEDPDGEVLYDFREPEERRVVGANFAYLVTSIISDPQNQCITFSCGALGLSGRPSAQKTGTSEPFIDSQAIGDTWTFGYTPNLVAGVWAGNSDNSPMVNIVSTSISWRAWRDFMEFAHTHLEIPATQFERPPGVVERELCWPSGRLPGEHCPTQGRYTGLFAADAIPDDPEQLRALQDTWWQEVELDTRTGLLATEETPERFRTREVRLVLPADEVNGWSGIYEWASRAGLAQSLAPTEDSSEVSQYLTITSPSAGQTVSGAVTVSGRVSSDDFVSYNLEWGLGDNPQSWVLIGGSTRERSGALGVWNTTQLANGEYTLRLRVQDERRGELRFGVPVRVDNGDQAPESDVAPYAQILSPWSGSVVRGSVPISGTAAAGMLVDWALEVGPGANPTEWTEIRRADQPVVNQPMVAWNTSSLEDGTYTLRLSVRDRVLGIATYTVVVTVDNGSVAADEDATDGSASTAGGDGAGDGAGGD